MSDPINQYGDLFHPTKGGHGVDISSQRQDELDVKSLAYIAAQKHAGKTITALDLGGGFGAHSIRMAQAGAMVTMIDIADMASKNFRKAAELKLTPSENLHFIQKDFLSLQDNDIPAGVDVFYSQRAIHYVPYPAAEKIMSRIFNLMAEGSVAFISAAGYDTEYGKTYADREKPIEQRFNFVTPDMQAKHGIEHRIVTYKKEEMETLLQRAGFRGIEVTRSSFGNIKAIAHKP